MRGTNNSTGKPLALIDHVRQSIKDILLTPLGSRVMRRDYGTRILSWMDRPFNQEIQLDITAEVFRALKRWEPRVSVSAVRVEMAEAGWLTIDIDATYTPTGETLNLNGITLQDSIL